MMFNERKKERKKWNSVATTGAWQSNGMIRNTDKGRCPLRLSEEDVIHILLDGLGSRNWRIKCLNDKLL